MTPPKPAVAKPAAEKRLTLTYMKVEGTQDQLAELAEIVRGISLIVREWK